MKKMSVFALLIFVILAAFIFWFIKDEFTTEKPLPVTRLAESTVYDKLLLIRREAPNGNLLLKLLNQPAVFRYDLQSKRILPVDEQAWRRATEKVVVCRETMAFSQDDNRKHNSYGKYALTAL